MEAPAADLAPVAVLLEAPHVLPIAACAVGMTHFRQAIMAVV